MTLLTFLIVLAFVLLVLATFKVSEPPRFSFGWGGIAILTFVYLLGSPGIAG